MEFFIRRSDGCYVGFSGMTKDQITQMLTEQNLSCEFLTNEEWNSRPKGV